MIEISTSECELKAGKRSPLAAVNEVNSSRDDASGSHLLSKHLDGLRWASKDRGTTVKGCGMWAGDDSGTPKCDSIEAHPPAGLACSAV